MFHYNGPTCRSEGECPPGLHYYFDYVAETEFQFSTIESFENVEYSCQITRGGNARFMSFFGVNIFLTMPDPLGANTLNSLEFIRNRVAACSEFNENKTVNFVYFDFWSVGNILEYATTYNSQ